MGSKALEKIVLKKIERRLILFLSSLFRINYYLCFPNAKNFIFFFNINHWTQYSTDTQMSKWTPKPTEFYRLKMPPLINSCINTDDWNFRPGDKRCLFILTSENFTNEISGGYSFRELTNGTFIAKAIFHLTKIRFSVEIQWKDLTITIFYQLF